MVVFKLHIRVYTLFNHLHLPLLRIQKNNDENVHRYAVRGGKDREKKEIC